MNWFARWCMDRCDSKIECSGCVRKVCAPRAEVSAATQASERLLEMLQCTQNAITHPNIADRIADLTGATSEERDTMVSSAHHGTYKPFTVGPPPFDVDMDGLQPGSVRHIVALDRSGNELARFPNRRVACANVGCSDQTVRNRCVRKSANFDEFKLLEMTFRFADEWDAMTPGEREVDMFFAAQAGIGGGDNESDE